ncbi:hypothetical protein TNCV_5076221 [Trichonephila clavipes]|uniref:Uncharacterized protein n=1 Tax=Trichonephila clavipes TaxID=2585209 RepID=A0A8X6RYB4_TRICX|nr:hypothetical protein TNCV_5076221 [Trichonephila clavipes]
MVYQVRRWSGFRCASLLTPCTNGVGTKVRKAVWADPLRSPTRDYWRRKRGPPRGFKGSASKLTRTFWIAFNLLYYFPHQFFRHSIEVAGATAPQGLRDRNDDDLLQTERRRL